MTRELKRLVGRWMILVLVLTQITVSAYACPSFSQTGLAGQQSQTSTFSPGEESRDTRAATVTMAADAAQGTMLNCDGMVGHLDATAPNLCDACCHHDQQSHHASSLVAPAVILNSLYAVPAVVSVPIPARFDAQSSSDLVAATPPHTVLHCCWRV